MECASWEPTGLLTAPGPDYPGQRAAVLVPLFFDGEETRLILIRRPVHMPTHPGDLAFPGGKPEPGETALETALREANEEVGIEPGEVSVLGYLPSVHTVTYPRPVVPVVGRLPGIPRLRPHPGEVDKIHIPSIRALSVEARWRVKLWKGHRVHEFDLDGDVLWGATARMVRRLVGLEPY